MTGGGASELAGARLRYNSGEACRPSHAVERCASVVRACKVIRSWR